MGASPTCTAAKPKAIDTKRKSRNGGKDTNVGESTTHRSPTAKRKRTEHSTDGEATGPVPVASSSGSNIEDPPAKKQHKNSTTSTGKSADESQPSTSTSATSSAQVAAL